jgi:AraC-like DNA-binding protein
MQENIYKDYGLPLIFKPDNIDEYLSYWHELKDAVIKNNAFVSEIKMTKLLNLLHKELGISPVKPKIDHCELVRDYIDANFESIISLDEIASLYEINKFTVSKKFTARYGISIIAYYNQRRLDFAKAELSGGKLSVGGISERLNFTDVYTFSKFFKMHTGVSPTDFRRGKK